MFSCEFCEISKNTFLTEHLRVTASVKIEMQVKIMTSSKRIYTPLPWPLRHLSHKPPHLTQHHCNNSSQFKILQQMSSEYVLSTSAYQNWLLICETGNKSTCVRAFTWSWVVDEMNYFETLDWFPPTKINK